MIIQFLEDGRSAMPEFYLSVTIRMFRFEFLSRSRCCYIWPKEGLGFACSYGKNSWPGWNFGVLYVEKQFSETLIDFYV